MKPAQLLLGYQRLVERERELRDEIERIESLLSANPDVRSAEEAVAEAKAHRQTLELRLRESDRERETHRSRLRMRERELMSGRIRNPTELIQMNQEVEHMRASFAEEEEAELRLMEEEAAAEEAVREASSSLDDVRTRFAGDEPGLRRDLEALQTELTSVKTDSAAAWSQVPAPFQAAFLRIRAHPAVAEVDRNQCLECHVTVTSSGMQALRKGEEVVYCDNCGRILVIA
jgi:predicted  nucleic acid-binding Zn-ribbon protein